MSDNDIHLGFSLFQGIGPKRFQNLLKKAENLQTAWQSDNRKLFKDAGISEKILAELIVFKTKYDPNKYSKYLERLGIIFLNQSNIYYPKSLLKIPNPPIGIFAKGNLNLLKSDQNIAVVGSRKMSLYGRFVTEKITSELVINGLTIVSGLALGIDRVAHEASLSQKGSTIAVLGNGVDSCFPKENERIYKNILVNKGLVISEYPPGTPPAKGNFPARNRIIAGISKAVLIVEAGIKSGSLITAEFGRKYKRHIFAVPGQINSPLSQGTNRLIKTGAVLTDTVDDILQTLQINNHAFQASHQLKTFERDKREIILLLKNDFLTLDEIAKKIRMTVSHVSQKITEMEIEGIIARNEEGKYGMCDFSANS